MAEQDKDAGSTGASKASELSFSQIQKAAELLKIKRFAQGGPASVVPAVLEEAPKAAPQAPVPVQATPAAPAAASPAAPTPPAAPAPAPSAPATSASSPAAPTPPAETPRNNDMSVAEPVSLAAPAAAIAAVRAAAAVAGQAARPVAPPAPAPAEASQGSGGTVPRPEAQAAAAKAEASLPPEYAELKRQALAKAQAQMPHASRLALPVGTSLQEYNVEWTLGIGGFGITYLAMDTNLEAEVAIKEYFPSDMCARDAGGKVRIKTPDEESAFKEGLDKFLKECRTLANFKHPNVVRVSRFFQANNTAYMVMDYESGESFKDWLAQRRTVEETLLLKMILPLLDGLDVVHKAGFLHRDIKPANIFVREDDSMVLLDFGAARHAVGTRSRSLTTIVTPGYAPFEQYHSHGKQGPWTDLYAFGGMMYWVITGAKPIEAPARIKTDAMVPASKAGAGRFSPSFLAAIDWALVPDENKRPQSVAEFKAALTSVTPVVVPTQATTPANPQPLPSTNVRQSGGSDDKDKTSDTKKWWKPWGAK